MSGELDALKAAVTKNNDLIDSAITLIQGIKAALDAAILSGDPAALAALSASLGAEDDKLAAAIVANTPPGGGGGGGTPTALAAGQVGVAYSAAATGHGGLAPLSFTLSGGALPDGLSLDLTSGAITGTPTVAGDFAFAVTFTDADAATPDVVDNYTIAIAA